MRPHGRSRRARSSRHTGLASDCLPLAIKELANPLFDVFRNEMRKAWSQLMDGPTCPNSVLRAATRSLQECRRRMDQTPVDVIVTDSGAASIAAKESNDEHSHRNGCHQRSDRPRPRCKPARPGGNVTGFSIVSPELGTKRLALLKEAVPEAKLVGVLLNPASPITGAQQLASIRDAAAALGVELVVGEAQSPDSISAVIDRLVASRISALMAVGDAVFFTQRQLIVDRATSKRLPGMYPEREYAEAGGLMAYGPNVPDNLRRAAGYVARILKGEKAGDLPVEQPVKFDLMINLKTAKAMSARASHAARPRRRGDRPRG